MNKLFLAGAGAAIIAGLSSVAFCASVEPSIAPRSVALTDEGYDLLGSKQAENAILQFETALAVDPKNVNAYVGLARAHRMLGLPGKAVKYYREGLSIDPTNLTALEEQGESLVERGAVKRAQLNLDQIKKLCDGDCQEASKLEKVIAAGPPPVENDESLAKADTLPDTN